MIDTQVTEILDAKLAFKYDVLNKLAELYRKKNEDYGNAASKTYMEYGPISYVTRIRDKVERYRRIAKHSANIEEDMSELMGDIINYCMMFKADMSREQYSINVEPLVVAFIFSDSDRNYVGFIEHLTRMAKTEKSNAAKILSRKSIDSMVNMCLEIMWEAECGAK